MGLHARRKRTKLGRVFRYPMLHPFMSDLDGQYFLDGKKARKLDLQIRIGAALKERGLLTGWVVSGYMAEATRGGPLRFYHLEEVTPGVKPAPVAEVLAHLPEASKRKLYIGQVVDLEGRVSVIGADEEPRPLRHIVDRPKGERPVWGDAPDRMDWRWGGPDVDDLALSILADFFGEKHGGRRNKAGEPTGQCWRYYQRFRFAFLDPRYARTGVREFSFSAYEIAEWLCAVQALEQKEQAHHAANPNP